MLNITKRVEYALIAIRHLNNRENLCSSRKISSIYNIPNEIMAKTLQKLCKRGYVKATKGSHGGYYLNVSIEEVNLIELRENSKHKISMKDHFL